MEAIRTSTPLCSRYKVIEYVDVSLWEKIPPNISVVIFMRKVFGQRINIAISV